jgi:hypothetical protein
VNTGLQLFFQSRIGRDFPASSIWIGFWSTNGFSRCLGAGFVFPASRYPTITCFRRPRFPLVPRRPMRFRGVWAPDSCSPHRSTPEKLVFADLDFHWFLVDQWGFETNGPQIRVPHIELPLSASKVITVCLLPGNVLLTRLQTNKQTNLFNFVRPSFQSREHVLLIDRLPLLSSSPAVTRCSRLVLIVHTR